MGEDLAKYKRLIIGQNPEKYTALKLWHIYCAFFEKQIDNETLTKSPFSTMFSSSSQ